MMTPLARVLTTLGIGVVVALGGCAEDDRTTPATSSTPLATATGPPLTAVPGAYVGRAGSSDVFVAVVPQRKTVRAYVCDAVDLANPTVDQWFAGGFDGIGPVTLTAGGMSLTLRYERGGFRGELTLAGGAALPFTAAQPADASSALLDAEVRDPATGAVVRDGNVIVLGGEQRGNMVPTRPPRCRIVLVISSNGQHEYVTIC